jgi:hypothetical protein
LLGLFGQRLHLQVEIRFRSHETMGRHPVALSEIQARGGGEKYEL